MKISEDMDLHQLAEKINQHGDLRAARHMCAVLCETDWRDTGDIPAGEWSRLKLAAAKRTLEETLSEQRFSRSHRLPFHLSFALPDPLRNRLVRLLAGPLDTPVTISGDRVECDIDEIAAIHMLAISARARGALDERQTKAILRACREATDDACAELDELIDGLEEAT